MQRNYLVTWCYRDAIGDAITTSAMPHPDAMHLAAHLAHDPRAYGVEILRAWKRGA